MTPADRARRAVSKHPDEVRRRLDATERLLEDMFTIPVLKRRAGLDAVIGLVPVVGDVTGAMLGAYLLWEARNVGMGKLTMTHMAGRLALDTAVGTIPFAGDLFDFAYRANSRNLKTIRKHLDRHHPASVVIEG